MLSYVCKISFKSVQVCGGCCKMFRGLTFLGTQCMWQLHILIKPTCLTSISCDFRLPVTKTGSRFFIDTWTLWYPQLLSFYISRYFHLFGSGPFTSVIRWILQFSGEIFLQQSEHWVLYGQSVLVAVKYVVYFVSFLFIFSVCVSGHVLVYLYCFSVIV